MKLLAILIFFIQNLNADVGFNIYADYIRQAELQIYIYNKSIDTINLRDGNFPMNQTDTSLFKSNTNNKVFHSSINTTNLTNCETNTHRELTVTDCKLKIFSKNTELAAFSLIQASYENVTQVFIDIPVSDNFQIWPSSVQKYFQFFDCKDSTCQENVILHPNYNEYYFKTFIQEEFVNKYDLTLLRAYLTVRKNDKVTYFVDVTQILIQNNYFYTLGLDKFPDIFDLYIVYQVRSLNTNASEVILFNLVK
jgi:hypothetical protein